MVVDKLTSSSSPMTTTTSGNEELRRELEQNYRRYIDNVYLFHRINEILLSGGSGESDGTIQKVRQQFLKAINLFTSSSSSSSMPASTASSLASSLDSSSATASTATCRLSQDAVVYLRERIGAMVQDELDEIGRVLDTCDDEFSHQRFQSHVPIIIRPPFLYFDCFGGLNFTFFGPIKNKSFIKLREYFFILCFFFTKKF